ncbi:MAG: ribonuclease HII [Cyanobacteria bacterium QH_9_48_43]|jgi:ribonuclease HII|nr:MAG: ribonuclease HII [Cyanobacteria bacterium QS_1_48_34]PSO77151.1 MAG: ribonuclease HII [Cyanobacteria bacterium QS_4_48_99]PSO78623.1 MAG: ribonuclease HII [Cyanobacteria bacterium QH_3_48_40]PSO80859.1 MAG: ribonuclease HII [Cyanobacteria bacterium QH_9_48_43]PSO83612.1 MAG: ribonuclease HII [Cyanobacteria bacterium QS_5_48_63]PSO86190.1 MAG: ribonuclease HII [Cyanobacteria bacterium QS_3_48_167]PSO94736.1 MAG: ribonuclease HII [Cyanobacteria bacterium QS_6_48_18]PSO96606.1 MAG: ribo
MPKKQTLPPFDCSQLPELADNSARVAGVDEVGRGALFGSVVASAVILPMSALPQLDEAGVTDSKQLSAKRRLELAQRIQALVMGWAIGYATPDEIDRINVFQASLLAMRRAVVKLEVQPAICLVDGNFTIPELSVPQKTLVKGDQRSRAIAAASIIAKVWRDDQIVRLAQKYPIYDLAANKGYATKRHKLALRQYGCSPQHRMSFFACRINR